MEDKVIITRDELLNNSVDEVLKRQAEELALQTGMQTDSSNAKDKTRLIYKSWFNLMVAGLIGGFLAWLFVEPMFSDVDESLKASVASYLFFALVGGLGGLFIGALEGLLCRNVSRALKGGLLGGLIGFIGGLVSCFFAGIVFLLVTSIGVVVLGEDAFFDLSNNFAAVVFIMIARSIAWCIAGMTLGLGPGIAVASKKLTFNGFIGGLIGGAIGGLLFDPINFFVSGGTFDTGAEVSRAIGFTVIGAIAGLMIGLVEMITMDAWFYMTEGPLKGKQFIIYKNPTFIGSSPKCQVYLFKDPYINPWHAKVSTVRDGYIIEDNESVSGTFVNGQRINKHKLRPGDVIKVGESTFIYREKAKMKGEYKK